jgi:class 3 adenylate cyclase
MTVALWSARTGSSAFGAVRGCDAISRTHSRADTRLQFRIGVATGLVVVGELIGEGSAQQRIAVGETMNLAARIQAIEPPRAWYMSRRSAISSAPSGLS